MNLLKISVLSVVVGIVNCGAEPASTPGHPVGSGGTSASAGGASGTGTIGSAGTGSAGSSSGGAQASGGSTSIAGSAATTGGTSSGGKGGTGGGFGATGGTNGGKAGAGGASAGGTGGGGKAGASAGGAGAGGAAPLDCSAPALTGGTAHMSTNASGTAAGLSWTIWSNGSAGSITTYTTPAFSAAWNNSGDFLARIGLQWNDTKTYDQFGTITAQFAYTKTGTGGGYSYIGIYGWSVTPCVEWYIVDDSYNKMPVNPGSTTNKGTAMIDGGTYTLYTRPTTGTGGSKCSGVSSWMQFYSVRQTARQCGQISISDHFAAWAAAGMTLGKMDQAQILVEVGGGSGSVNFTTANVTASM